MRPARVVMPRDPASRPSGALILVGHGSKDPRSAAVAGALAGRIRRLRPWLDVQEAFLEQCGPRVSDVLADVATQRGTAIVVPMLLASAYHTRTDLPSVIEASGADVHQAEALGEDPALIALLGHRLTEYGVSAFQQDVGVIVVAVGSSDEVANARTATVASALAVGTRWAGVEVAFATGPDPTVADAAHRLRSRGARRVVIAPWFIAPGRITDRVAKSAVALGISMAEPLGAHNLVAATLLDRFDEAASARVAA